MSAIKKSISAVINWCFNNLSVQEKNSDLNNWIFINKFFFLPRSCFDSESKQCKWKTKLMTPIIMSFPSSLLRGLRALSPNKISYSGRFSLGLASSEHNTITMILNLSLPRNFMVAVSRNLEGGQAGGRYMNFQFCILRSSCISRASSLNKGCFICA